MAEKAEGCRLIQNSDSMSEGPPRVVFLFAMSAFAVAIGRKADTPFCSAGVCF